MPSNNSVHRLPFFPKADAAILTSKHSLPPTRPQTVGPIYDRENVDQPIEPLSSDLESTFYPQGEDYATASVPDRPLCFADRYLRAFLAENERLRLSMLWYYTRDILKEDEFLSGLQEKAYLATESTGWEFAVIGILDVNVYIRLATVGLELGILPRGETICAHTVTQPPGSVFLLPSLMEDWRFRESPYREHGGLLAYAGAPLRLQTESGDCVALGTLCVASGQDQEPLTKTQHQALVRLADWVVSDLVQCARVRRQRERRQMSELLAMAQREIDDAVSEEPVLQILRTTYPTTDISLQSFQATHVEAQGRNPIQVSEFEDGLWEDTEYLEEFIANSNHLALPCTRTVRIISSPCESISGSSLLVVASKDFRLVFDDVDSWFVQTCAGLISQMWRKRLLIEAMNAKEKFLQGFSHQLRTPIHGILGSVELLAEELQSRNLGEPILSMSTLAKGSSAAGSRDTSMYLNIIKTAGRDLTSIVNNMITLNRWADIAITDRHYAMHTVTELEAEIENEILKLTSGDTRYETSIFFAHNLPPGCESFRIDLGLLRDSLLPIVINSVQNTPQGIVLITTSIRLDSKQLTIDVEDTGRGIHPDDQQRIFEPYEKVDLHSAGAGLGLTLASKFITLLHGSVDLISSQIDRGSHFRATLEDVECACSPLPTQPLASKLNNLPSKFFNMATSTSSVSLCGYFTNFLTHNGLALSDSMEDCLVILDAVPDLEQHCAHLAQIPLEQVAICLIPASQGEARFEQTADNVVYVSGPFSTSIMCSALEKAQNLLLEIKASRRDTLQRNEPLLTLSNIYQGPSTGNGNTSHPSSKFNSFNAGSGATVPPTSQLQAPASIELSLATLGFPNFQISPRPTALIVDDNAVNLRVMEMYCTKRKLPFFSATDGRQAVEIFSRRQSLYAAGKSDAIQLIFMDLQMPVCDGIEATKQIRSLEQQNKWGKTSLFVMTGQDSAADRIAAEKAGADEYFTKPVIIKQLDGVVKRYIPAFEVS